MWQPTTSLCSGRAHPPTRVANLQEEVWPELTRRLAAACTMGAMVQRSDGAASGGLDIALGPNVGATPLAALGPGMVLQALLAGAAPAEPVCSMAALPWVSLSGQA